MHLAPHRLAAGLRIASLSCIGAAILVPGDSPAQTSALGASPWQSIDYAQVRLIAAQDRVGGGVELDVALHVRLDPGWHTYWRADGGVGFPPRIDWSGSANLSRLDITWPAPHRIFTYGYEAIGYENEVVFPMRATLAETGAPLHLRLDTMIAVCRDICIPFETSLTLELPAGTASATPYARLIERYADRVPRRHAMPGFDIETVRLVSHEAGTAIEIGARAEPPFDTPDLFIEGRRGTILGARTSTAADDGRWLVTVDFDRGTANPVEGEPLTVTLVDRTRAIERSLVAASQP